MNPLAIPFDDIAGALQTGDIVLMHGLDESSQGIQFLTGSIYSHVGLVVRPQDIGLDLPGCPPLLWESVPMHTIDDVELHFAKAGPTLVNLIDRIRDDATRKFDSIFAVRHLYVDDRAALFPRLETFIATYHDRAFPANQQLIQNWLEGRLQRKNDDPTFKTFFCSELVALTMQHLGLLSPSITPNFFAPADFSEKRSLPLLRRAFFGPERFIDPGVPTADA